MDDRLRTSDADRDRVAARLRDHFAEGRLTREELDERLTAALGAKTFGDLRRVLADLPEPGPLGPLGPGSLGPGSLGPGSLGPRGRPLPRLGTPFPVVVRRGPRLLPLAILALVAALVLPGASWLFLGVLKLFFLFWLAGCVAAIIVASRVRRSARRRWHDHGGDRPDGWPGPDAWPGRTGCRGPRHRGW